MTRGLALASLLDPKDVPVIAATLLRLRSHSSGSPSVSLEAGLPAVVIEFRKRHVAAAAAAGTTGDQGNGDAARAAARGAWLRAKAFYVPEQQLIVLSDLADINEEREKEQQRLHGALVAEVCSDMISLHDNSPEACYRYASPACQALLGYAPAELVGRSVRDFYVEEETAAEPRADGSRGGRSLAERHAIDKGTIELQLSCSLASAGRALWNH